MYARFKAEIEQLNQQVLEQAGQRPTAGLLMTHPGVGPITALATDVFLGDPKRFRDSKARASYIGIIPSEHSSGGRQRLGGLSKQGNPLLRFLWCEAAVHAVHTVRRDPELSVLSAQISPERSGESASRGSTKTGDSFVDHVYASGETW
jgi:transposase